MNRSRLIHERSLRTAHRKAITALNATINKETTVSIGGLLNERGRLRRISDEQRAGRD
jgi:hypothetical protein